MPGHDRLQFLISFAIRTGNRGFRVVDAVVFFPQTMAKKVPSVASLHNRKKKQQHIKHSTKRHKLRTVLKKILEYMKSDTYLFAPLVHPQSCPNPSLVASSGEVESDSCMNKKERKFAADYLTSDCYMYSPLVTNSASEIAKKSIRRIVVKEIRVQREVVKRVVGQNWYWWSSPLPGEKAVSRKEPCKIVVE